MDYDIGDDVVGKRGKKHIDNEFEKENYNMSDEDIETLKLLNIQKTAQIIFIYSDILSYISTLEGIELIYRKYRSNSGRIPNPDILAVQSVYLAVMAKMITTKISFTRYKKLYKKQMEGEFEYSLEPNININTGNVLGLISYFYLLSGAIGLYERDLSQPVFGI